MKNEERDSPDSYRGKTEHKAPEGRNRSGQVLKCLVDQTLKLSPSGGDIVKALYSIHRRKQLNQVP